LRLSFNDIGESPDISLLDRPGESRSIAQGRCDQALPRFFDVPEPRQRVLERLPYELYAAEVESARPRD
jgi:hypothetical protein